jgi:hypothetical protein
LLRTIVQIAFDTTTGFIRCGNNSGPRRRDLYSTFGIRYDYGNEVRESSEAVLGAARQRSLLGGSYNQDTPVPTLNRNGCSHREFGASPSASFRKVAIGADRDVTSGPIPA